MEWRSAPSWRLSGFAALRLAAAAAAGGNEVQGFGGSVCVSVRDPNVIAGMTCVCDFNGVTHFGACMALFFFFFS